MENILQKEIEKRGYLLEEFRLFHLKDAKGARMEYHYHDFCKLVLLVSGQGEYTVEDRHYSLRVGDILLIGSGQIHRPEFSEGLEYERIILYISPEFLKKQSTEDCNLEALFDGIYGHVLRLEERRYQKVFSLAEILEKELKKDSFGKSVLGNSLLLQLLVRVGRYRDKGQLHVAERQEVSDERIKRMLIFMENHLSEELSVEFLAEQFFISRYHLMRLFKKETGQSLYDYLTERRLFFARELIRQGVPATESCFQAGFGSYSSFTRAYGKRFGTTPTGRNGRYLSMDETEEE
ncbi:MAG: helix-turn-helix domain-containing protein [Lachnospiraceae bacterium]|nr:helix-turn-helix domain-containing protein [Lachnospiraceae bacterium]